MTTPAIASPYRVDAIVTGAGTVPCPNLYILSTSHVQVWAGDVLQVLGVNYTVTISGGGCTIQFITSLPSNTKVTVLRNVPNDQSVDYVEGGPLPSEAHETALDKLTMSVQMLQELVNRTLRLPVHSLLSSPAIGTPVANQFLRWNSSADGIESAAVVTTGSLAVSIANAELTFANGTTGLDSDPRLTWDDSAKRLTVGNAGAFNSPSQSASMAFLQRNVADEAAGILNFPLNVQLNVASGTATQASWRSSIMAQAVTAFVANGFAADISAGAFQANIAAGNADGRATGVVAEAYSSTTQPGSDGLLIAVEASIINQGSFVSTEDDPKAKINLWISTHQEAPYDTNWKKVTAAIAMTNTPGGWHYGWLMRHIAAVYLSMRSPSNVGAIGIDIKNNANWGQALVCPNAVPISWYNSTGSATRNVLLLGASDALAIGQDANITEVALFGGSTRRLTASPTGLGFFTTSPIAKPTVTGAKGSNAALGSLLTALANFGLITDSTSA